MEACSLVVTGEERANDNQTRGSGHCHNNQTRGVVGSAREQPLCKLGLGHLEEATGY